MARTGIAELTEAERVALRRFMQRKTAKVIAAELKISPKAVELRLKSARDVLGVLSSAEAAQMLWDAEGKPNFRNTPGGQTEVGEKAGDGFVAAVSTDRGAWEATGELAAAEPKQTQLSVPSSNSSFPWPLRSQRRPYNDLMLRWRIAWPLLILIGLLISTGIMINSLATLTQILLTITGHRPQ